MALFELFVYSVKGAGYNCNAKERNHQELFCTLLISCYVNSFQNVNVAGLEGPRGTGSKTLAQGTSSPTS